ncbi:MAG: hypothetical protein Q7Q71_03780 [Verrucomicrobiota bacterium JB023]|nr:hypothetical protein [Verrucomicrobiota bacterium JB023]
MKYVFYGVMVLVAYGLGKVMYEPLKPALLGVETEPEDESIVSITVESRLGRITEKVDLTNVDPAEFPEKITLRAPLIVKMPGSLDALTLEPNSKVKPISMGPDGLLVETTLGGHQGTIAPKDTDFAEGVARKRVEIREKSLVAAQPDPEPAPQPTPEPAQPEPVEVVQQEPEPEVMEPEPEPAPEPAQPAKLSSEEIVAAMQSYLKDGKLKEFDFEQVSNWEARPEEESFDGEMFQVGVASYEEETILGKKTIQALALFSEGQLVKWVYAQTKMEIR